jgi:hypothetical protein
MLTGKQKIAATVISLALTLGGARAACAGVMQIGTQAAFSASGTILQNTNWDAYGAGFFFPGSPFTVGDLTFVEGSQNLIGGTGTGYNLARNLFTDNGVAGTTTLTADTYDLLGFNAGNFFGLGTTAFTINTNLASYTFNETVNTATNGAALSFFGFEATGGEHFTSFHWSGDQATGLTDIQLGAVPEPASLALVCLGLAGLGFSRRKQ